MWNHNTHYHSYLLHRIPKRVDRALDVGCGLGHFARKLAEQCDFVDALDVDDATLTGASTINCSPNIAYLKADFLTADLPEAAYDVIVSIAAVHHMDMEAALKKMKLLLRPSGKLLILGLYREKTLVDYAYSLASIPLNFLFLQWHRASITGSTAIAPTRPARLTVEQIKVVAGTVVPGFCFKRHLLWRYSLVWQKPC
ncbi:class I SAM-dependent methyltransferase [Pseudanabaena sp. FACHB-2040]|uniref:class I SAM-dependent methyltransferase n=1 Tax=Pseudanabaena sp. FACHB-2040 TaxID=2692859 RepID=UPI001686BA2B|nr:class I SAM-dependent methyltransferase [Pseudanabaena sp. FACHB-2040]MBD2257512.1 class I SAM-dependent methyltransferase [Pseudanabaena sp. FACHB-2040]